MIRPVKLKIQVEYQEDYSRKFNSIDCVYCDKAKTCKNQEIFDKVLKKFDCTEFEVSNTFNEVIIENTETIRKVMNLIKK